MATPSYNFGYTGQFAPASGGQHLQMINGILSDVGYTMPQDYYISRVAASWRSGVLTTSSIVVTITINNVAVALTLTIASTDITNGYKVASATANIQIDQNEHLGLYAVGDGVAYLEDLVVTVELESTVVTGTSDAVLANISVLTTDLQAIRPDITQFMIDGETDFSKTILQVKKELYAEIKLREKQNYTDYTNAELDTQLALIKDYPLEESLKQRIKLATVGEIFRQNRLFDEAEVYTSRAKGIPLQYYIDDDSDTVVDDSEREMPAEVKFGR